MTQRVCPWWLGYLLASPLRRLMQDPVEVLAPYVREGQSSVVGQFDVEAALRRHLAR